MKFIPGKYYECRDGRKALFVGYSKHGTHSHAAIFEAQSVNLNCNPSWTIVPTTLNGYFYSDDSEHAKDIMNEWEDRPHVYQRILSDKVMTLVQELVAVIKEE